MKNQPWPEGTPEFVSHRILKRYIQTAAEQLDRQVFSFNTRVERIWKEGRKWKVLATTMNALPAGKIRYSKRTQEFDAVIVASGHYHKSCIPDIPGLNEWKAAWPDRIEHSKGYRHPSDYKNQNVLLIGAGTSSTDIARELDSVANQIYQVSRGGKFDLPIAFLPSTATRIGEISSFHLTMDPPNHKSPDDCALQPITGTVKLKDGTALRNIHRVIICTGYQISYPFLSSLHRDLLPPHAADPDALVTDGTQNHNLHKDIFYLPDPTLAFVGVPYYTATFSLFEFQAIAVAAVFAGHAQLPPESSMRREYAERLEKKGYGRSFHSLREEEEVYVRELVDWLNADAKLSGAAEVEGHTEEWRVAKAKFREMFLARLALKTNGV